MNNFQRRLSKESRGYVKTALTTVVETSVGKGFTGKGASWLAKQAAGKTVGKIVSGPIGILLEAFWPSNTIVSGAEEMRMLREYRMRMLQTSPPWEKLPQSILAFPRTSEPTTIRRTFTSVKPDFPDRLNSWNHTNYRVDSGDTLWKLAPKFGYNKPHEFVQDFQKLNRGVDPNRIFADKTYKMPLRQQLAIEGLTGTAKKPFVSDYLGSPTSISFRVNRGDTLWKLAPQFGYQDRSRFVKDFQKLNPGVDPNRIYTGKNYIMPNQVNLGAFRFT
ncbi:LysM domain-containing protein [Chlorogloeopsis sp. ULAP01]|uniref:LysM peptidoglycan-binding domain-containing protein n=1 Tax=Chlorogloeopsis sp. ULAP01 TaxID=3056483 RepID=UPI0025AB0E2E|nr:LysM domain-containing protein [Chlorogloeopsis sp. ULAP01]MDM9384149.1 LysM domain-containing protein [Chlorogloeopsis sp. ULAP01]